MYYLNYVDVKPFTWEPPLNPPCEKFYCKECESLLECDKFGQLKSCSMCDGSWEDCYEF